MSQGRASIEISQPPHEVWAAIADITRMGEWSPECVAGRWVGDASGPAPGARFEGDNKAKVTESFSYEPKGLQGFVYDTVLRRPAAMTKGMARTLQRLKVGLEA